MYVSDQCDHVLVMIWGSRYMEVHTDKNNATLQQQITRSPRTLTMFFAHFNTGTRHTAQLEPDHLELRPNRRKARSALRGVRNWKASGPDGVPERVLEACADQLAEVFREIFNLSLTEAIMPSCLKSKTTEPIPEQKHVSTGSLNDHRPVSLTLAIVKG